jgi:two-component system alkaline phosphatase synthesis response regulator PhoP
VPVSELPDRTELLGIKARGIWVIAYGQPEYLRAAFLSGCDDYLKEPWNAVELASRLERLRAVGGSAAPEGGTYSFSWGELCLDSLSVCSPTDRRPLSLPEYRILATLLRFRGQAVPREVLRYTLWGRAGDSRSRCVDVHISSLRRKILELFPRSKGCLRALRGTGYSLV